MIWLSLDESKTRRSIMDDDEVQLRHSIVKNTTCAKYLPADLSPVICGELSVKKAGWALPSVSRTSVHYWFAYTRASPPPFLPGIWNLIKMLRMSPSQIEAQHLPSTSYEKNKKPYEMANTGLCWGSSKTIGWFRLPQGIMESSAAFPTLAPHKVQTFYDMQCVSIQPLNSS